MWLVEIEKGRRGNDGVKSKYSTNNFQKNLIQQIFGKQVQHIWIDKAVMRK